jgi:hypothetical protein
VRNVSYKCFKPSDYERHLGTAKHRRKQTETKQAECKIQCECGKEYSNRSGLFKHKKKCTYKCPEDILKEEMKEILEKQQQEQRHLIEIQQEEQRRRDEEQRRRERRTKRETRRRATQTAN